MKPLIPATPQVDVDHINPVDRAGRHSNQRARTQRPKPRDVRSIRDRIFETVGRGWAFVRATWKDMEGAAV
jgi:hypothetical protein